MNHNRFALGIFFVTLFLCLFVGLRPGPVGVQGEGANGEAADLAYVPTAFTYQGRLTDGGAPADGLYDFKFELYDTVEGIDPPLATLILEDVLVTQGFFTEKLYFGEGVFDGNGRWLGIGVRPWDETGAFTSLAGRQEITLAPYAIYAQTAPWEGLVGVPAGFADGIDNGITSVSWFDILNRPSGLDDGDQDSLADLGPCDNGQSPEWSDEYATWECGDDDDTTSFWSLGGNAGTSPGPNYLGTSDNQALELGVNNSRALRIEPESESPNLIGGYSSNSVFAGVYGAFIGGGGYLDHSNHVSDHYGTVGGGASNLAGDNAGSLDDAIYATVAGGLYNRAKGAVATVSGGAWNLASGEGATISGGSDNEVIGDEATVSGGESNLSSSNYASVGGGFFNHASGLYSTVAGGNSNSASGDYTTICGGQNNYAGGPDSTIGGGQYNTTNGTYAAIGGGYYNFASGEYSTIGGGGYNTASGAGATIAGGGGYINIAGITSSVTNTVGVNGVLGTIGGGAYNYVGRAHSTVAGGYGNEISSMYAFIGGGRQNLVTSDFGTLAGGLTNIVTGTYGTVGGGVNNLAVLNFTTVGGGENNTASGTDATVGGGKQNIASGTQSTVSGGASNTAGYRSTVSGGLSNAADSYGTVPGGYLNYATGHSFAAGRRAKANNQGSFVFADSNNFDFATMVDNSFKVRTTGGVRFVVGIDGSGNTTASCVLTEALGGWSCSSDRDIKQNFRSVEGREVLERLSEIPITRWNAKGSDLQIDHMGPMAQDFYAAFGLGDDERLIASMDADGVALAAIQGLYTISQEQEQQIKDLQAENSELRERLAGGTEVGTGQPTPILTYIFAAVLLLLSCGLVWVMLRLRNLNLLETNKQHANINP